MPYADLDDFTIFYTDEEQGPLSRFVREATLARQRRGSGRSSSIPARRLSRGTARGASCTRNARRSSTQSWKRGSKGCRDRAA